MLWKWLNLVQEFSIPSLSSIGLAALITLQAEEDILKTYDLTGNCYITTPVELEQFIKVVKSIEDFWLTIVKLPPNGTR